MHSGDSFARIHVCMFIGILLVSAVPTGTGQTANKPITISERARPIEEAAVILQSKYAKPVTYEDPVLVGPEDTELVHYASGKSGWILTRRSFSMPPEADPEVTPLLDAALIRKVLDSYEAQTNGPRFKVSISKWGLHIIPAQVRNQGGDFIDTTSLLDTIISVPVATRTPSEHFEAICASLTASTSTGIAIKYGGQWMDQYFSPTPLPKVMTYPLKEKSSFSWGITLTNARDAIVNLLGHSATTLSWKLLCQYDEGYCVFTPQPIVINVRDPDGTLRKKALTRDRSK